MSKILAKSFFMMKFLDDIVKRFQTNLYILRSSFERLSHYFNLLHKFL